MLHDGTRPIKPADVLAQVPAHKFDAVVVLGLGRTGEPSEIFMSTLTINELCFLAQQLNAHITCRLGPMIEGG